MRIKESAHDYRYFPDPDLLPVKTSEILAAARTRKPELPWEKRSRYVADFGVTDYDAAVLANDLDLSRYFETAAKGAKKPKNIANWMLNDLQSAPLGRRAKASRNALSLPRPWTSWSTSSTPARSAPSRARKSLRRCSPAARARLRS